jgi:hypothetical protein
MPGQKGRLRTPSGSSGGSMSAVPSDSEKACRGCGLTLPLTDFTRQPAGQLGVKSRCKLCMRGEHREYCRKMRARGEEDVDDDDDDDDEEPPVKRARVESDLYIMAMSLDPEGSVHGLKVGRSANIPQRSACLSSCMPFTMLVLATFTGAGDREDVVHAALAHHRNTNGRGREWFHVSLPDMLHAVACALQSRNKVNGGPAAAAPTAQP